MKSSYLLMQFYHAVGFAFINICWCSGRELQFTIAFVDGLEIA